MKKTLTFLTTLVLLLLFVSSSFAQEPTKYQWLAKNSWAFSFGGSYPKLASTNIPQTEEANYGGYLSIQKNFSEHLALRLEGNYLHIESHFTNGTLYITNDVIAGNIDMLYYFVPCEPVSPYLVGGLGAYYSTIDGSKYPELNDSFLDYQMNIGLGSEWRLGTNWRLKTELAYHTPATTKFDGEYGTENGGLWGGIQDSYMKFDLGFMYYFAYGEKSNICQLYEGVAGQVDYDKIEDIVRKYQTMPEEVDYNRIEDLIIKHKVGPTTPDKWVLLGINFDFDKATIRPESTPILYNAADILLTNPDLRVEIQGHTDNIGSESYNMDLSQRRAETVKMFLVAKGVDASRLTTKGFGESQPVATNKTPQGRELNRRIEFKVISR